MRVQEALSGLIAKGLVDHIVGAMGSIYVLSPTGRKLVLAKGYVRESPK